MNKLFLIANAFLLVSCSMPNDKVFNHGIGQKGEKINSSYLFSEGKGDATRLFVITGEGASIRQGKVSFSSGGNEAVVKITEENRGVRWDGKNLWGSWVKDKYLAKKEVYVIFLKDTLIDFPEKQPILIENEVFPKNSDFYLWGMSKWSIKKIE